MSLRILLFFCFVFLPITAVCADPEPGTTIPTKPAVPSCPPELATEAKQTKEVTANTWDNFRNNPGSLRFESAEMLSRGLEELTSGLSLRCPDACVETKTAKMKFTVVPREFLEDYSDKEKCHQLFERTKQTPMSFPQQSFQDLEGMSRWIGDFSQGKGNLGEELYRRCDGACSPQYHYSIWRNGEAYELVPRAVCGPARDKWDNKYKISYSFRVFCKSIEQ